MLIVEDADVPLPRPIVHALTAGIDPAVPALAEGALNLPGDPTLRHGVAAFGKRGYLGPKPLPGHGPHRYLFQLFALDAPSGLDERADRATAIDAMAGHVLATGVLMGTSQRG